jgi:DNA-binding IclR family transcriptional regulator
MKNLTEKEQSVLNALIAGLYAEEGFSDVCAGDLSKATGLNKQAVGGVLTSLQDKGYVWVSEAEYWMGQLEIPALVYLCEEHYDLHPKWEV